MGPGHDDLDDEIRGHIALSIRERIERGEDPDAARLEALNEQIHPLRICASQGTLTLWAMACRQRL